MPLFLNKAFYKQFLLTCSLTFITVSVNATEIPPHYVGGWGNRTGAFNIISDISSDKDGNVYVTDMLYNHVQKFNAQGKYVTQFLLGSLRSIGEGFSGVTVDSAGNIYIADLFKNILIKANKSGKVLLTYGGDQIHYPTDIVVDSQGKTYTPNYKCGCTEVFNRKGVLVKKISGDGSMSIDATDNLYMANATTIKKFDKQAKLLVTFGSKGSGNGQFGYISSITVDTNNNIYALDYGNNRIQKFDSQGNYLSQWESNSAQKIIASSQGYIYAASPEYNTIQIFDNNGKFIKKWGKNAESAGEFSYPLAISFDSFGNSYIADTENNRLQKLDPHGKPLMIFGRASGGADQRDGHILSPAGVTVDSRGNIYVIDARNSRVQKFDSQGKFLTKWGSYGSANGQFQKPTGTTVDLTGNILVLDSFRIQKFDSQGNFLSTQGSDGTSDGQFKKPRGIAVDNLGNMFVADTGNNRIQKFDSNGNFVTKWGTKGLEDSQFSSPIGIATDKSGNVYVTDAGNYRVQKFDNQGNFLSKWGTFGGKSIQFGYPIGVGVSPINDKIHVLDSENNRIQIYAY